MQLLFLSLFHSVIVVQFSLSFMTLILLKNTDQFIYRIYQLGFIDFSHEWNVLMCFWQKLSQKCPTQYYIKEFMMFIYLTIGDLYLDHLVPARFLYYKLSFFLQLKRNWGKILCISYFSRNFCSLILCPSLDLVCS